VQRILRVTFPCRSVSVISGVPNSGYDCGLWCTDDGYGRTGYSANGIGPKGPTDFIHKSSVLLLDLVSDGDARLFHGSDLRQGKHGMGRIFTKNTGPELVLITVFDSASFKITRQHVASGSKFLENTKERTKGLDVSEFNIEKHPPV
jgi:hypothetical protein